MISEQLQDSKRRMWNRDNIRWKRKTTRKWTLTCEDSDSSGRSVTFDSGTGNSKSKRLSAVMQTRPRWLMRLQLKLKILIGMIKWATDDRHGTDFENFMRMTKYMQRLTEWFPSLVFLTLLTRKVFLTVSPANTGQQYTHFPNPTWTFAASSWLMAEVRKSTKLNGITRSCSPRALANGVDVWTLSCEWKLDCQKSCSDSVRVSSYGTLISVPGREVRRFIEWSKTWGMDISE